MQLPPVAPIRRRQVLWLAAAAALVLFVWQLGSTGLVDETPPLFAASARAMAETGDWLIPRVNGLPRYDKPPLIYWAMGLFYALPGQAVWNPLGTWAARLPSALACGAVMLALADTLLRRPQRAVRPALTALTAALAFGLSPLVLLWGRIAVSDALFSGLLAGSALLAWRCYASGGRHWWHTWLLLGLAVLAKGPVALLLLGLTLLLFGWLQTDLAGLWARLRPLPGLAITTALALPWFGAALLKEGEPFWSSFFGYHNLQRFSAVVNNHQQPWWFFGPVLVIASLPLTPMLVLGLLQGLGSLSWRGPMQWWQPSEPLAPELSLQRFAACWLLAVLLFFTVAATKLPSYWLPATPAAGLLVALSSQRGWRTGCGGLAWGLSLLLTAVMAVGWLASPLWVSAIVAPEMPSLVPELLAGRWLLLGGLLYGLAAALGWGISRRSGAVNLLCLQLPLLAFVPLVLQPAWHLGDRLRGLPVRQLAAELGRLTGPAEPVAMIGMLKPSLHYYGRRVVIYEGDQPQHLLNLADRLRHESRPGQPASAPAQQPSVLVVIDSGTAAQNHWQGLNPQLLNRRGIYALWRLERSRLEKRADQLRSRGLTPDWRDPRPERY
ncbi:MAG: glycosyltransferase family 39 protein [Cyanobacteria bacterium]|nr:glycosyltransferase family 39 protein [Cyanobacteriota bacterium]MDA1246362.1 glycosyltransferase family 39 protein [Cyanobacteriota bacterium]